MPFDDLVKQGRIRAFAATPDEVARSLEIARRDLALARQLSGSNLDWSYAIAYNAVLQAARALMFHLGYRPAAEESHKATIDFLREAVTEPAFRSSIDYFDRARRKRHRAVYDEVGIVGKAEAEELLTQTAAFLDYVERRVSR